MTILVPPAILGEVQTVLDSPMVPDVTQYVPGRNAFGVETGNEVARIMQHDVAVVGDQLTIDASDDSTIRQIERFANVVGVF